MRYESTIVAKPWGYEYLAYENEHVALWFLYIKHTHATSLHCHPKKTTGLVLLDGGAEVSFFNNSYKLTPGGKIMIRKGLFHTTRATDKKGAFVFEIETPVDKQDLVRFRDSYGREGKPYEDSTHESPKAEDCLWITEDERDYQFANCTLSVKNIVDVSDIFEIDSKYNVMFLRGGLQADYKQNVSSPGDVVLAAVLHTLAEQFTEVDPETLIMIIKPNE